MNILYRRTPTFKFIGIFFTLIGFAYLVTWWLSQFVFSYLIPIALLNFLIGALHYFVHHKFYIICNSDQLIIRSHLIFITRIKCNKISKIEKNRNQITIHYDNAKRKNIYYKFMSEEDLSRFEYYIQELNIN